MEILFDGYTGNRCGGGREWKYIPQICKDILLGSQIETIGTHGVPFRDVVDELDAFIRREATEPAIIIAHGGCVL